MDPDSSGDNTTGVLDGENARDSDRDEEQPEHEVNDDGDELSSGDESEENVPDLLNRYDDSNDDDDDDDDEEDDNHADEEADQWNDDRSLDDHEGDKM